MPGINNDIGDNRFVQSVHTVAGYHEESEIESPRVIVNSVVGNPNSCK